MSDGGKQLFMRDTIGGGEVQQMTLQDGKQKEMKCVLEERGVNTYGMKAYEIRRTTQV